MKTDSINAFNIRVYGLIINQHQEVLVTDEFVNNTLMTKFPGGGLEFGEGPIDCIKRECREEMEEEIEIINHFYTTDFFQQAAFYENMQLISIYYRIRFKNTPQLRISNKKFDFEYREGNMTFRWLSINRNLIKELTFPIDKIVADKLTSEVSLK
jgi:ADP-ribose pyrophosphatase YjhB (NUDIX family)